MDAHEDELDIKLQKISGDLIADFDRSLRPYLYKATDGPGAPAVRSRVRSRETYRLISTLLDPFQELPYLLDPHLPKWMSLLTESFLEYLGKRRRANPPSTRSNLLMPLPTGICKIIYTFCKIRGEKVIVRFLNNETRHLEPLLSALEESDRAADATEAQRTWEQRYVVLLWLSHLFLAPFDLATISSVDIDQEELPPIPGFQWPAELPGITIRVLPLAVKYLASPGRERGAAKALLVRLSMRRDMQDLGVLDALVQWTLYSLRDRPGSETQSSYYSIGVLSFLAGVLASSADTSDMDKYLDGIFNSACASSSEDESSVSAIKSSALARKMLVKVIRSTTVLVLRDQQPDRSATGMVETAIGYLLESLADNDTPMRFAASKALSVITLRLDMDMASQVVEAVLDSLNRNVLWTGGETTTSAGPTKDLSAVNLLEWHGLMLTLSHLLYRRSPPAENLADIIQALLMGLSFEQRSTSGSAVGANVRDASCFGLWALARRYTTKELLAVPTKSLVPGVQHSAQASVLQILATELIVTASLDPSGNIRRGSSAALQELIGRHPDTVEQGISVVQTVDYHAVALRARAIREVASNAAKLSSRYGEAILAALLSWRGVGAVDPVARRAAAASFGAIAAELAALYPEPVIQLQKSIEAVLLQLKRLQPRQVDERHGLLLAFAAGLEHISPMVNRGGSGTHAKTSIIALIRRLVGTLEEIMTDCKNQTYRRPELVAEAASHLVVSSFPLLQAFLLWPEEESQTFAPSAPLLTGPEFVSLVGSSQFADAVSALDSVGGRKRDQTHALVALVGANLSEWLKQSAAENIAVTSQAGLVFLASCGPAIREDTIRKWAEAIRQSHAGRTGGQLATLVTAYPTVCIPNTETTLGPNVICDAISERWSSDTQIETRVSILQSLTESVMLKQNAASFLRFIEEGLDDYTTNARGDVGSHVRLQAIRAAKFLWQALDDGASGVLLDSVSKVFLKIVRLAAEKLDRVRVEAQSALNLALTPVRSAALGQLTFSSSAYFTLLLNLLDNDWLRPVFSGVAKADRPRWMEELLAGYVSSADTGNEDLVIASRAALTEFCEVSSDNLDAVCTALLRNLGNRQGQDRVIVPTLEIVAFLFRCGIYGRCREIDYKILCLRVQKACYKTGNMRKIEACVKVYGAVAAVETGAPLRSAELERRREVGIGEARKRLGALLLHPWPRVRAIVVDELWGVVPGIVPGAGQKPAAEKLKGMDWGTAERGSIKALVQTLDLA